jgi:hypothetical protein
MPVHADAGRGYRWYSLGAGCEFLGWSRTQAAAQARRGVVQTVWARDKNMARRIWAQTHAPDVCRYSPAHQQSGVPATGAIWLEGLGMSCPACLACQELYGRLSAAQGVTRPEPADAQGVLGCGHDPLECHLGASCPYPDCQ